MTTLSTNEELLYAFQRTRNQSQSKATKSSHKSPSLQKKGKYCKPKKIKMSSIISLNRESKTPIRKLNLSDGLKTNQTVIYISPSPSRYCFEIFNRPAGQLWRERAAEQIGRERERKRHRRGRGGRHRMRRGVNKVKRMGERGE